MHANGVHFCKRAKKLTEMLSRLPLTNLPVNKSGGGRGDETHQCARFLHKWTQTGTHTYKHARTHACTHAQIRGSAHDRTSTASSGRDEVPKHAPPPTHSPEFLSTHVISTRPIIENDPKFNLAGPRAPGAAQRVRWWRAGAMFPRIRPVGPAWCILAFVSRGVKPWLAKTQVDRLGLGD